MKTFREALAGGPQLGFCLMYPAPGILERVGPDWDWIWIDGQHGEMGYGDILAAVRACNLIGRPALVRVPGHEAGLIGLALDTAADAVMVPMVDTPEQAKAVVQAAKFPPLGGRSYGGRRPIDLHGRAYSHADRPQPLLICQIETQTGLTNARAIAAVEGVDGLFFGPDDMALRMGMPMDQPRPEGILDDALAAMAQATAAAGKVAAGVFPGPEELRKAVALGYRLIVGGGDVALLATGSQAKSQALRGCLVASAGKCEGTAGKSASIY